MSAAVITKSNFEESIQSGVTLVDFWAPWCGPCRAQSPIIDELSKELAGQATIAKVNVDDEGELAAKFSITTIPSLIIFKDGKPVEKMVGLQGKEFLKNKIVSHLS